MTHDQHIASDPEISVWVSASAGTGKTKVLTDRVLRLLLAGVLPSKILCITYTKAAAAEMEQRIDEQLGNWAVASEDMLQKQLAALTGKTPDTKLIKRARKLFALVLDAPQRLRIETIHGFCQSVLKRFPLEAGVPPHFTVIDNHTAAELMSEARVRLFREAGSGDLNHSIEYLARAVSESVLSGLIDNIIKDSSKFIPLFEMPSGSDALIEKIYAKAGLELGIKEESLLLKHFIYTNAEINALKSSLIALMVGTGKSDKDTFAGLKAWLEGSKDFRAAEAYIRVFITKDHAPRKTLCTQEVEKKTPGTKDVLLAEQSRVFAFANALRVLRVAQASHHMIRLADSLLTIYRALKNEHGYMDFEDIILKTLSLLKQNSAASWVLYKLDGGIDHLLVDEAQDTSPAQWQLVDILTAEFFAGMGAKETKRTLFVVGDSKQSIFSFQGAEPKAFADMQSRLRKRIASSEAEFRNVQLALSFRSTEPVLKAIDAVFAKETARDGLVFDESDITHSAHRKGMAGRVEIWPLVESVEMEETKPWQILGKQSYRQRPETHLAHNIVAQIKTWLNEKRIIASQGKVLRPGDIMILVQRRGAFTSAMLRALKRNDIPVAGADRMILTEHIAIEDCVALANFLLLPQDDLTLAVVLKSPFVGLSEEDLFELAYERGKETLWQRLKKNKKFLSAYDYLSQLLAKVDYLPPYELFSHILETLGGRKKLAERLGAEVNDPLNEFLALALNYDRLHVPSLQGFLHWLESGSSEVKRDMEKGRDEVRIMTVHGAKGLQAPIVFLPDTTRLPRYDTGIFWDEIPYWSPSKNDDDGHITKLKEVSQLEKEREYRRLLYVAMTRAEDELYVCGWKGYRAIPEKCWYELIKQGVDEAWQKAEDKYILSSEQTVEPKTKLAIVKPISDATLPAWLGVMPKDEPTPPRPLAPSRMDSVAMTGSPLKDQKARLRGILIHRLLQYLPDVEKQKRDEVAQRLLKAYAQDFTVDEQEKLKNELFNILNHPEFAVVFSSHSIAEAPVSGVVEDADGKKTVISGQVDRICVNGNDVYIIDYKTSAYVPEYEHEVPHVYIKQMVAYRDLVAKVFPDKTVRCALLWTSAPKLMPLTLSLKAIEVVSKRA